MSKVNKISGRVHDSFNAKMTVRKGWFNFFCFTLGLVGGTVMRDEIYYPNLQKTDELIAHWKKCDDLIQLDIDEVDRKLSQVKKIKKSKSKL